MSAGDTHPGVPPATPRDTSAAAEEVLLAGYRRMSPAEKLARVADLDRAVEAMAAGRMSRSTGI